MRHILVLLMLALLAGCATDYKPRVYITPAPEPKPILMPKGLKDPIAELIVICHPRKYVCQRFLEKVPYDYDEHIQAYILPLVEANLSFPLHGKWYRNAFLDGRLFDRAITMPTFIVWQGDKETGHELARWTGFTDMGEFLEQVDLMIEMYDLKTW